MAILAADMQAATNDTAFDGILPYFETNDVCYRRSEVSVGSANGNFVRNPYRIANIKLITKGDGTGTIVGADGTTAAVGSSSANVGITASTGTDTHILFPWFYDLVNVSTGKVTRDVHESDLLTLAGVKDVVDVQDNSWTDPA